MKEDGSPSDHGLDVAGDFSGPDAFGQQPVDFFQELAFAASPLEKRTRHDSEFCTRVFDLSNESAKKVKIKVFLLPIELDRQGYWRR